MTLILSPERSLDKVGAGIAVVGVVLLALLTLYLVGFDTGVISRSGLYMHELMHDGRHLMGLPCH
ncbi:CbtB-domain containing protein [Rhodococcus sp. MS16]|uniref:CbtB domain-containing protein n=1 Tax=Rhodococcus sp. MS16 TaxID=2579941 RepID=UPI001562DF69|nr:CbtB-domain containing protein [Rhodococcus sp. MS16]NRI69847.1 CbtB-domain containing protein [Rhodococcus sp. MS16]